MSTLLVDVRSREEFDMGHRYGALNIPIEDIMSGDLGSISTWSKDAPIECYCASGARSERAKQMLQSYGYTNVTNIGGFVC